MVIRLVHFYGAGSGLASALADALGALGVTARSVCAAAYAPLTFALFVALWMAAMTAAGALHEYGMRERVAREGCPFADNADVRRLPEAREREMAERYC